LVFLILIVQFLIFAERRIKRSSGKSTGLLFLNLIFSSGTTGPRYPLGGRGYYEIEILERDRMYPQYGFAATALARVLGVSDEEVGDGLFAVFPGKPGKVHFNLGEADFRHAPPAADFQACAAFEG
jgi:hypothetical protein